MPDLPPLKARFPEPVVDSGSDPYVVIHAGHFYYCHSTGNDAICIRKAGTLDGIGRVYARTVWETHSGQHYGQNIWAPELHHIDDKWYIYYSAGPRVEHFNQHRMYVLEGTGDDPQLAEYAMKGQINDHSDCFAIDGTVLEMADGRRYYLWSGRRDATDLSQRLYIAKMKNPWTLEGEGICISSPVYAWERRGLAVNEGPQVLYQGQRRHVIYSASWSEMDNYCLAQLSLLGDNPLDPTHWAKHPMPIFESQKGIVAPGHASFILTPDETYGWMIFHSARHTGARWNRQVRLRAFRMSDSGRPEFVPESTYTLSSLHKIRRLLGLPG